MLSNDSGYYQAYKARDARFDGVFYIGVLSTGIYCRPICPARTPKFENCHFYSNPALAEQAGFRPCLRCRPELAPGLAIIDNHDRIAAYLTNHLITYKLGNSKIAKISEKFGISSRQLQRIIINKFGIPPGQLILTSKLLLAKKLLTETKLSIIDIAFASGFNSLRRFNDAFKIRYRIPPSSFRKDLPITFSAVESCIKIKLCYRKPYDFEGIIAFLAKRLIRNVEAIVDNSYIRVIQINNYSGYIKVSNQADKNAIQLELSHTLSPVLATIIHQISNLFDLNPQPDLINEVLGNDPVLAPLVLKNPGLRVPGCWDGFELSVRAIVGQQITVGAATTILGRLLDVFTEKTTIASPTSSARYSFPTAIQIATMDVDLLCSTGIIRQRAQAIISLAKLYTENKLDLTPSGNPAVAIDQLLAIKGIGPWTAQYIIMRALKWPDSFPKEDIVIRKKLGNLTARQACQLSQNWQPWRSYAVMHLWNNC